mgnify:CR=1 FL=1
MRYNPIAALSASIYNNNEVGDAHAIRGKMRPITDIIDFSEGDSVRLGEIAEGQTMKEAIVVVPYISEGQDSTDDVNGEQASTRKEFFSIARAKIDACLKENAGTADGDSLDSAGESIRKLVQKLYIAATI